MEILLNLVWVLVMAAALACWSLANLRVNDHRGQRLLALVMVLLLLFPAISITDDLWAAHNPAEADAILRRYDEAVHQLGALHHTLAPFLISGSISSYPVGVGYADLRRQTLPVCDSPDIRRCIIRPPPVL